MSIIIKAYEKRTTGFLFARDPEILQRETGRIISARAPAQDMPDFEVDYSLGYPMVAFDFSTLNLHYVDLSPELDFVYTLYAGERAEDVSSQGIYARIVIVFDYQGNVVKSYELDHALRSFSVDEKGRKIFGITYDEDPNVVVFDL